jgi:hypothetical protein
MVVWFSALAFAIVMVGMWIWVGHQRRNGHVKKPPR